jgi:hypothetical protein
MIAHAVSSFRRLSLGSARSVLLPFRVILCFGILVGLALPLAAQQTPAAPAYPLKLSSNHRYLLDQNDTPFLIVGDSPQGMVTNISTIEAEAYFANRAARGFNAVLFHVLCKQYYGGRGDYSTYDGITPFTTPGDISTPSESYFERVDAMITLAAQYGISVFLGAGETVDSLDLFRNNGVEKSRAFGEFLGNRYKDYDNIVWSGGADFQTWRDPNDNAVILAVSNGIKDAGANQLHTIWLDYFESASRDSPDWAALVDLDFVYSYWATYDKVLRQYALSPPMPVFLGEANYEEEDISVPLTTPEIVRRQEYWTMTSGGTGSFYGNYWTWVFRPGWQDHYDSPGSVQMAYFKNLFQSRAWWKLVPDPTHQVLTSGFGRYEEMGAIDRSDYATAALASDSSFMIAYLPSIRTVTVNMSKFSGRTIARWYDPSNGTYFTIAGSPFSNSGPQEFTPPGNNSDGNGDWVLVIEPPRLDDDFNGDGKSDIVWKHTDESSALWLMNGLSPGNTTGLLGPGTGWSVQHIGDFNADGKSDIAWGNTDGSSAVWLMDGTNVVSWARLLDPDTGWSIQHIGDFNGDGKSDIVWSHTDGSSAMWLMNGMNTISWSGLLGPHTGWSIQHIGDFNGDGKSDVVWGHTDGSSAMWLMNGMNVIAWSGLLGPATGWSIQHIGDFNGDGKSDIVWRHTDGSTAMWLMDGMHSIAGGGLLASSAGWSAHRTGDFNGDGNTDIVWLGADGSSAIWLMSGQNPTAGGGLLGPSTGWTVQCIGDFNGDGNSDIVLEKADGSTAMWLMNGLIMTDSSGLFGSGTGWSPAP